MPAQIPELDKLFEEVGTYRSSADFVELLKFIKRFRHIAPYNAMLIHIQKPGSVYVASASDWKNRFNRDIKPGARPLVILRPFGPVAFVYEVNDTQGDNLPPEIQDPFEAYGIVSELEIEKFIRSSLYSGIRIAEGDYGSTLAGQVQVADSVAQFNGKSFRVPFSMTVNRNLDTATKLATIYHELGHVFCGHLFSPQIKLPQRYYLSEEEREFEAESVCWLLCERQGIVNPSAEYLNDYLGKNGEIPNISVDAVLKAVGAIEQIKMGVRQPKKELILD